MIKRKKALSEIVAYVILITIGMSLASLVFVWLKYYVTEDPIKTCPEGATLIIEDYSCSTNEGKTLLNLTIKNKGLFTVDGFLIKVNDREDSSIGVYTLYNSSETKYGQALQPDETVTYQYSLDKDAYEGKNNKVTDITQLRLIEVQPFIDKKNMIFCESVSSQGVKC